MEMCYISIQSTTICANRGLAANSRTSSPASIAIHLPLTLPSLESRYSRKARRRERERARALFIYLILGQSPGSMSCNFDGDLYQRSSTPPSLRPHFLLDPDQFFHTFRNSLSNDDQRCKTFLESLLENRQSLLTLGDTRCLVAWSARIPLATMASRLGPAPVWSAKLVPITSSSQCADIHQDLPRARTPNAPRFHCRSPRLSPRRHPHPHLPQAAMQAWRKPHRGPPD